MASPTVSTRDHLILQGIVLVWGITSILGKEISLEVQILVTWRTGIAALALGLWLLLTGKRFRFGLWERRALMNGCVIGLHWYLFFLAARLGNVSVAITGAATSALWVSLLEPLVVRGRKLHLKECLLALAVTAGVALVAGSDDVPMPCLLTGILAAAVAALFSIFNSRIVHHLHAVTMSFYEMLSASLFCGLLGLVTLRPFSPEQWLPLAKDWAPLLTLALLCTVFAFSVCVWLQKRVPAFTIGLAANIEPVYGMVLAALIYGSREVMGFRFYTGAAVIIGCVVFHTFADRRQDAAEVPLQP